MTSQNYIDKIINEFTDEELIFATEQHKKISSLIHEYIERNIAPEMAAIFIKFYLSKKMK